ncbi:MAG: hypothetical protein LUD81_10390 [Clostridiales bacterium]|nr:hypothetical protein [Clostridiales bacterium]
MDEKTLVITEGQVRSIARKIASKKAYIDDSKRGNIQKMIYEIQVDSMLAVLKVLGIKYSFEYDEKNNFRYTAVIVDGVKVSVDH